MSAHKVLVFITLLLAYSINVAAAIDEEAKAKFAEQYALYQSHVSQGDWNGALPYAKASWYLSREILGDNHSNTAKLGHNYALNLSRLNENAGASDVYTRVLISYEAVFGEDGAELIPLLLDMASTEYSFFRGLEKSKIELTSGIDLFEFYEEMEKYDKERDKLLNRAVKLGKKHMGDESPGYAELLTNVGSLQAFRNLPFYVEVPMRFLGQSLGYTPDIGRRYLYDGHKLSQRLTGSQSAQTGNAAYWVGKFELQRGNEKRSITYLNEALVIYTQPETSDPEMQIAVLIGLVRAQRAAGNADLAAKRHLDIASLAPALGNIDAQLIVSAIPDHPPKSAWVNETEWVIVEYKLDKTGTVVGPFVSESSGVIAFHPFALEAIEKFLYTPRIADGKAVDVSGMEYRFGFSR